MPRDDKVQGDGRGGCCVSPVHVIYRRGAYGPESSGSIHQCDLLDNQAGVRIQVHRDAAAAPKCQRPYDDFTLNQRAASRTTLESDSLIMRWSRRHRSQRIGQVNGSRQSHLATAAQRMRLGGGSTIFEKQDAFVG